MKAIALACLGACSFTPGVLPPPGQLDDAGADADDDAPPDGPPQPRVCDPATGLLVCLSFDPATFGPTMANEGTAPVTADLTAVMRSDHEGGGAAEVTPASKIYIPGHASLVGASTLEMWARIDLAPVNDGARIGLLDADTSPSAMSFFYYRQNGTYRIRFEIGVQLFLDHTVTIGSWVYLAQTCDGGTLTAYVDGMSIGSSSGCSPGNGVPYGLILAGNNLQGGNKNDELTGAIDALRIWTTVRTPAEICDASTRTDCP